MVMVRVRIRVLVCVTIRIRVRVKRVRGLICSAEPSRKRVKLKVSHVIVECRVISYHRLRLRLLLRLLLLLKREFCNFFPKTTIFHINWYYIGNVSTMYDFLNIFSSTESILA